MKNQIAMTVKTLLLFHPPITRNSGPTCWQSRLLLVAKYQCVMHPVQLQTPSRLTKGVFCSNCCSAGLVQPPLSVHSISIRNTTLQFSNCFVVACTLSGSRIQCTRDRWTDCCFHLAQM